MRRFLAGPNKVVLLVPVGLVLAWFAGIATAQGGNRGLLVMVLAVAGVAIPILWMLIAPRSKPGFMHVEIPVFLLLLSGLVFRQRETDDLLANPLDLAGSYRAFSVLLALAIGLLAITTPTDRAPGVSDGTRFTTRPFRLYALYVAVVFIGALPSVNPPLTAYRGIELVTGVIVMAGAYRMVGRESIGRILALLYWWTVVLAGSVWLGTILFPGEGLHESRSPLGWQLKGILPAVSSNGVGTIGAILVIWSLVLVVSKNEDMVRPRIAKWMIPVGLVTLVLAQYRTGYVATAFGTLILIAVRQRQAAIWVLVVAFLIGGIWGPSFIETAQPYALRGQSVEQASELSSRLKWWSAAIPLWQEKPIVGAGLLTGTRFEVLAELGRSQTSTIHGTWIEALVGTGIIGVGLLAAAVITLFRRALAEALRPDGRLLPLLLMSVVFIRSLTGSTFEAFGSFVLLLLAFALSLRDEESMQVKGRLLARSDLEPAAR